MIIFKTHNTSGLALIEVLLAILLIGSLGMSLLNLQSISLERVVQFSEHFTHLLLLDAFLVDQTQARYKQEEPIKEKSIQNPPSTLTYRITKPAKNSSLASLKHLVLQKIEGQWLDRSEKKRDYIIRALYQPPSKKEQTAS